MSRRAKIRWISYCTALFIVLLSALAACHVGAGGFVTRIDAHSSRSFGEAFNAVERLDRSLRKCEFAAGRSMETILCAQIYSGAQSVQTSLSMLPIQLDALERVSKQISTMGDYAFSLFSSAAEGNVFSEDVLKNLSGFSDVTRKLLEQLEVLRQSYEEGTIVHEQRLRLTDSLNNLALASSDTTETLDGAFHRMQESIPSFPEMHYDGAFSDWGETDPEPSDSSVRVSQSQAQDAAAQFLDLNHDDLEPVEPLEGEDACWRFAANGTDQGIISVSKSNGEVIRYLTQPAQSANAAEHQDCGEICRNFLLAHGYQNMVEDETFIGASNDTACFVFEQDGVLCLPDRIVMRADPSSGKVTAFDASAYRMYHHDRELPSMDPDFLRSSIPENLSVQSSKMVLMLSPGRTEHLCAEYQCQKEDGASAKVYVDAQTGQQLKIVLEDETERSAY